MAGSSCRCGDWAQPACIMPTLRSISPPLNRRMMDREKNTPRGWGYVAFHSVCLCIRMLVRACSNHAPASLGFLHSSAM